MRSDLIRKTVTVLGSAAALACVAAAGADGTQTPSSLAVAVPQNGKVTVIGREFAFEPNAIRVTKGQHVTITFINRGALSHNLTIPALDLHTATIQTGAKDTIAFDAAKSGVYRFWCTVPGHKEAGMEGAVTVR